MMGLGLRETAAHQERLRMREDCGGGGVMRQSWSGCCKRQLWQLQRQQPVEHYKRLRPPWSHTSHNLQYG